ncbi:MAG: hypothetical protein R6V10_11045 [bacterium]
MVKRLIAALVLFGILIFVLQVWIDRRSEELDAGQKRGFTPPNSAIVKTASMGYHTIVADLYWLRAIQYYSESVNKKVPPVDLYPLTDFITDLDPDFCVSYYFAGQNMMLGGVEADKVIRILEKGKKHCPEDYRPPFLLGYLYYFYLHEPEKSADNMEIAARLKDKPYFALLASRIRSETGRLETSMSFLEEMLRHTEDEMARKKFRRRMAEIRTRQMEKELNRVLEKYRQETGSYPAGIHDLIRAGFLEKMPENPMQRYSRKYHFVYDEKEKRIRSEPPVQVEVHESKVKKQK